MIAKTHRDISADERWARFQETFGNDFDASNTLAHVVTSCADYLAEILDPEAVNKGMAEMLRPLEIDAAGWRDELAECAGITFSEWPLGRRLHDLAAYATYGICVLQIPPSEREGRLERLIEETSSFLERSPLDLWGLPEKESYDLVTVVKLAKNRWALDSDMPIDPAALAYFGKVSEGRIRNLMSGGDRTFKSVGGKIPAHEALTWLSNREEYWPSIWQDHADLYSELAQESTVEEPVFIPVSRDGSIFHPGLCAGGSYTVGTKGDEKRYEDFETALHRLQSMPTPCWRRPNDKGHRGIVSGVRWARLSNDFLASIEVGNNFRLAD